MSTAKPVYESDDDLPAAQDPSPDRTPLSPMSTAIEGFSAEITDLEETVRGDVTARLREEFERKLGIGTSLIREHLEQKLGASIAEWEAERRRLVEENEELGRLTDVDMLREEIKRTETALGAITEELAGMVENPNVKLSDVMRKKTEQSEQHAYLRGLGFRSSVDEPSKD